MCWNNSLVALNRGSQMQRCCHLLEAMVGRPMSTHLAYKIEIIHEPFPSLSTQQKLEVAKQEQECV